MDGHDERQDAIRLTRRRFLTRAAAASLGVAATQLGPAGDAAWDEPAQAAVPERGGVLGFATAALPASIEPHLEGADIWQKRKPLIFENLVWIDYNLQPRPQLAEAWERRSDVVYTFKVREGVKFHGGKVMDAEDVK